MDFNKKLIEQVRKNEILYNLQHMEYRNTNKKDKLWKDIGRKLNSTAEYCRKKWKSLRDTYKKYQRQDCVRSGSSAPKVKRKWKYFELLTFLDNFSTSRLTISDVATEDTEMESSEINLDTIIEKKLIEDCSPSTSAPFLDLSNDSSQTTPSQPPTSASSPRTSRVRRRPADEIPNKFTELLDMVTTNLAQSSHTNNTTVRLFQILAEKIIKANLPNNAVYQIEAEVFALVYAKLAEYKQFNN